MKIKNIGLTNTKPYNPMKNYESLLTKVEECTEEFKKNLRYNEFEKSLTDLVNKFLAEHIQTVLETLMHDKRFLSVYALLPGSNV